MGHGMNRATILCPSCKIELWRALVLSNGQPVIIPVELANPHFGGRLHSCPNCFQDIFVGKVGGESHYLMKDEETGSLRVA